jgi:protein MAK11
VGNWAHMATLTGHKGSINDVAIHPSGALALSVARDGTLRMWDLASSKLAARMHFKCDPWERVSGLAAAVVGGK